MINLCLNNSFKACSQKNNAPTTIGKTILAAPASRSFAEIRIPFDRRRFAGEETTEQLEHQS